MALCANAQLTLRWRFALLTLASRALLTLRFINSAGWRIYEELISLLHRLIA
jgi:hypothetical protein